MGRADLIGGAAITVVGLLLIFWVIPTWTAHGMYYGLPPTFFPTVMATGMTASAAALTIQAWLRRRREAEAGQPAVSRWNLLMFLIAAAIILGGVIAIDYIGVLIAGPVMMAALMIFLGERNPFLIVLTSGGSVGFLWYMSLHVLGTPLP